MSILSRMLLFLTFLCGTFVGHMNFFNIVSGFINGAVYTEKITVLQSNQFCFLMHQSSPSGTGIAGGGCINCSV